jgi:hypothetical protein
MNTERRKYNVSGGENTREQEKHGDEENSSLYILLNVIGMKT